MKTLLGKLLVVGVGLFLALTGGAQPVTKIATGPGHTLLLKSDGSLWVMGLNGNGQLGDGTYNNTNRPELIVSNNVTAIAAGGRETPNVSGHSLFLKSDGSLWAMGYNGFGQLGDGTKSPNAPNSGTNRPEEIVPSNVTAIAAGSYHSLFLKSDGSLWAMGNNTYGQLGDGTYGPNKGFSGIVTPEEIVPSNVTAIAAGGDRSLFLKSDGSLWAMGENFFGELGDGTLNNTNRPEMIVASNVTAIATGGYHSLFIKSDGSLWAMGLDNCGQLGDGVPSGDFVWTNLPEQIVASNVTAIAAGGAPSDLLPLTEHSLFLMRDGSLWGMGYNGFGELGDGTYNNTNLPELIVANNVTAIAAGGSDPDYNISGHSLFLKSDGSLWGMGYNGYGELGDGTLNSTNLPEQILAAYNRITNQVLGDGTMQLAFVGIAGGNYALDSTVSLSPANWIPQATNRADALGNLIFTNAPDPTTNDFWRIRSVP